MQDMKTACHGTKLGPHLIKPWLFKIHTFENVSAWTPHGNVSPWGCHRFSTTIAQFFFSLFNHTFTPTKVCVVSVWPQRWLSAHIAEKKRPKRSLFQKSGMRVALQVKSWSNVTAFTATKTKKKRKKKSVHVSRGKYIYVAHSFQCSYLTGASAQKAFDFHIIGSIECGQ